LPACLPASLSNGNRERDSRANYLPRKNERTNGRPSTVTHVFPAQLRAAGLARDVGDDVHARHEKPVLRPAGGDVDAALEQEGAPAVPVEALMVMVMVMAVMMMMIMVVVVVTMMVVVPQDDTT